MRDTLEERMALSPMIRPPLHQEPTTPWKDRGALRVILAHACFQCFAPLLEVRVRQTIGSLYCATLVGPHESAFADVGVAIATGMNLRPPVSYEILRDLPPHLIVIDNTAECPTQTPHLRDVLSSLETLGHKVIPLADDHAVVVSAVADHLAKLHEHLTQPL